MPQSWLTAAAALLGQRAQLSRLTQSLQVDSTRIREHLHWTPPCSVEAGLAETAEWFRGLRT
jgi:UDP-glucose 4-epimerase